jgi:hypothetical protein
MAETEVAETIKEPEFTLTASEAELLEEFGVLLAAEYNYAV